MKKFLFYFLLVFSLSILSAFKAYSQPPTVTHEVIAYTMATTVIDNFNMIDTKSDTHTTLNRDLYVQSKKDRQERVAKMNKTVNEIIRKAIRKSINELIKKRL